MVPAGAQVATVVVVVVLAIVTVVVVGGTKGAHNILAEPGVTVRAPNWSLVGTSGRALFGHLTV
jgi:hypothetical protein